MQIQLSQKEKMILQDEKNQEELCVIKYQNYASQAQDPSLQQLLNTIGTEEQNHYNWIDQMLQGQQPNIGSGQQSQQQQGGQAQQSQQQGWQAQQQAMGSAGDKILCNDLLSTEKYVSGTYDTGIFEAANPTVRQTLQHIQKEEQHHGELLFNYMNSHGMYNVQ